MGVSSLAAVSPYMQELQTDGMPGTKRTKATRASATPKVKRIKQRPAEPTLRMLGVLHPEIDQWVKMGLDPSLSRTGYAFMLVTKTGDGTGTTARGPPRPLMANTAQSTHGKNEELHAD
jgi:hypothetical protein